MGAETTWQLVCAFGCAFALVVLNAVVAAGDFAGADGVDSGCAFASAGSLLTPAFDIAHVRVKMADTKKDAS